MRTVTLDGPRGVRLRTMIPEGRRERRHGLIGRRRLEPDEALLLERARSVHTFGMRFSIAAALLDDRYAVRAVVPLRPRRLLLPRPGVRHVLEVAVDAELRPGDRLRSQS